MQESKLISVMKGGGGAMQGISVTIAVIISTALVCCADTGSDLEGWTLAGDPPSYGMVNGPADVSQFDKPRGVTYKADTKTYIVADSRNNCLREVKADGSVSPGYGVCSRACRTPVDGKSTEATFCYPKGVAYDPDTKDLIVADTANHCIRKIAPSGEVSTLAGPCGSLVPGAHFSNPHMVIHDEATHDYIVADGTGNCLLRINPIGTVFVLAGKCGNSGNYSDGEGDEAQFNNPKGATYDPVREEYIITDTDNNCLRVVTRNGSVTTLAGLCGSTTGGAADGHGFQARFDKPDDVSYDHVNKVYIVVDSTNNCLRSVSPDGDVVSFVGKCGPQEKGATNAFGSSASFNVPEGISVNSLTGDMVVTDSGNDCIRTVSPTGEVHTLTGRCSGDHSGAKDGKGSDAKFFHPMGIANEHLSGMTVIADTLNHCIRSVMEDGTVRTIAGYCSPRDGSGTQDGIGSTARFHEPQGVGLNSKTKFFIVADTGNNCIREISPNGVTKTIAGKCGGLSGFGDGKGEAVRFSKPTDVTYDPQDDCYFVADSGANCIRKITTDGTVTTFAGRCDIPPYSEGNQDGPGVDARFSTPFSLTMDPSNGFLIVLDSRNGALRKILRDGTVSTLVAGSTTNPQFSRAQGITYDADLQAYIVSDSDLNCIKRVTSKGDISTLAGLCDSLFGSGSSDGENPRYDRPSAVAYDRKTKSVLIADTYNDCIRVLSPPEWVHRRSESTTSPKERDTHDHSGTLTASKAANVIIGLLGAIFALFLVFCTYKFLTGQRVPVLHAVLGGGPDDHEEAEMADGPEEVSDTRNLMDVEEEAIV